MGQRAVIRIRDEHRQLYTHWGSGEALRDAVRYALQRDPAIFPSTLYTEELYGTAHGDLDYPHITILGSMVEFTACRTRLSLPAEILASAL